MIYATLAHIEGSKGLNPILDRAIDYVSAHDLSSLGVGRHEIEGSRLYVMVSEYETKDDREWILEAHRNYIDLQLVISGSELFLHAPLESIETTQEYSSETDCLLGRSKSAVSLPLSPGSCAVFFPWDAHKCCLPGKTKEKVRKLVFKVQY